MKNDKRSIKDKEEHSQNHQIERFSLKYSRSNQLKDYTFTSITKN